MDDTLSKLQEALERARETEKENRAGGNTESRAWDAGRVTGLEEACEIVQGMMEVESITP